VEITVHWEGRRPSASLGTTLAPSDSSAPRGVQLCEEKPAGQDARLPEMSERFERFVCTLVTPKESSPLCSELNSDVRDEVEFRSAAFLLRSRAWSRLFSALK
jgi:hypothetical protein